MNRVILLGYLTADPDFRNYTDRELKLCRFSIAVTDMRNFSQTYFFNCIAWNQTADYVGNNLKKGDFICVDGKLTTRSYINNEGKKNVVVEIVAENIKNIGTRKSKKDEENEKVSVDEIFSETNSLDTENVNQTKDSQQKDLETNKNDNINNEDNIIDWEEDLK